MVIEDEAPTARALARIAARFGRPTIAGTLAEALSLLEGDDVWAGLLVDIGLPDGDGLELVLRVREADPLQPAMIVSALLDARTLALARRLSVPCCPKPWPQSEIEAFLSQASLRSRIDRTISAHAERHGLTASETDILRRAVLLGATREEIAQARGTSVLTVKKQIDTILLRSGARSFDALVAEVLRDACLSS